MSLVLSGRDEEMMSQPTEKTSDWSKQKSDLAETGISILSEFSSRKCESSSRVYSVYTVPRTRHDGS